MPLLKAGAKSEEVICSKEVSDSAMIDCDVKVHPDDWYKYLLDKKFRTVGKGELQIKVLVPDLKSKSPCLYEALMEHEKVHVKNNERYCSNFKKCVDEKNSTFLWIFGEPTISKDAFDECYKTHYGGKGPAKDCIEDEKIAYVTGIRKAQELKDQSKCAKEKTNLEQNIQYWESIKDSAPNCKKGEKTKKIYGINTIKRDNSIFQIQKTSLFKPLSSSVIQLQAKEDPDIKTDINALKGSGQLLPESVRAFFEPHFGHDFSQVRVHTDTKAIETANLVNAQAFTVGKDVVFGAGKYSPGTASGDRLLAHELTHVVQQQASNEERLSRSSDCSEWGGFRICGNTAFVRRIRDDLNTLNRTSQGSGLLMEIAAHRAHWYRSLIRIESSSACGLSGTSGNILFAASGCNIPDRCPGSSSDWASAPNYIYLFHEIVHAYLYHIRGEGTNPDRECMVTGLGRYFTSMPYSENRLRCELGLPVRPCYDGECRSFSPPSCESTQKAGGINPEALTPQYIHPVFSLQRQTDEEKIVQCKNASELTPDVAAEIESNVKALKSVGQPLPESIRAFFELRFGHDFSKVRVHCDSIASSSAKAINSRAYTIGNDIVFSDGHYMPQTNEGRRLLAHELTHVLQQRNTLREQVMQRWVLKSSEGCLIRSVNRARTLINSNLKQAESAYGKWGCTIREFADDGKGPQLETIYGGAACALSWKDSSGEDLISINPGLIDCCKNCPNQGEIEDMIAFTIIHETAHWCAATHNKAKGIEHGDDVEKTLFGNIHLLENCVIKKYSSYGNKPCFTCPYVVRKGDSLWKISEKIYADGAKWRRIYDANRKRIGDNPNFIYPGIRLIIPTLRIQREILKQAQKSQIERKACVKEERIPDGHTGAMGLQGVVHDYFKMTIDWDDTKLECNCGCGEYRQFVKGYVRVNGRRQIKKLYGGATLEENVYHEDTGDDGRPYGHREGTNSSIDKFIDPVEKVSTRATTCSYRGSDTPGLEGLSGVHLDMHLVFKGQVYDRCKKSFGKINEWETKWNGIIP
jgi:hypothetical protein